MQPPRLRAVVLAKRLGTVEVRLFAVRVSGSSFRCGTLTVHSLVWAALWRPLLWLGQSRGLLTLELDEAKMLRASERDGG